MKTHAIRTKHVRQVLTGSRKEMDLRRWRYGLLAWRHCKHSTPAEVERIAYRMRDTGLWAKNTSDHMVCFSLVRLWFRGTSIRGDCWHTWATRSGFAWIFGCNWKRRYA